jgi:hypothetical protein
MRMLGGSGRCERPRTSHWTGARLAWFSSARLGCLVRFFRAPVNSGVRRRVESKQCCVILSKGLPLPPRLDAASAQACAFVSFNDSYHVGRLVAACSVPSVASWVACRGGWCVAWSVQRVVEWRCSAGAANESAPEQLIAADRNQLVFHPRDLKA